MSGSLALGGVFTGIDSQTLISATMAANRLPLYRLEEQKADYESQKSVISDIEGRIKTMKSLIADLSDTSKMRLTTASSSDHTVVGASSASGAQLGSYNIEVNRLATSERKVHDGIADKTTALGGGAFVYTYNGEQRTITLNADATLEDLRDRINSDSANPGVIASILEYDDGAGGVYHLVLSGKDTGSDYGITVDAGTTLAGFDEAGGNWTVTQAAQDSQFRIDGYPAGDWITRSGNQVSDAIEGVTLNLRSVGTETITIERSSGKLVQDVNNMVDSYNSLKALVDHLTGDVKAGDPSAGLFRGDSTLRRLLEKLREPLTSLAGGFADGEDAYVLPAQIGIEVSKAEVDSEGNVSINTDGKISFDEEVFNEALENNFDAVVELLGAMRSSTVSDADYFYVSAVGDVTDAGEYEVKADFDGAGNVTAGWFRLKGETEWRQANVDGNTISGKNDTPEDDLFVQVTWDGVSASQQSDLRVRMGIATSFNTVLNEVTHYSNGLLTIKKESMEDGISTIESKIERMENRMEQLEKSLQLKYARMEMALAQLDALKSSVNSLVSTVSANEKKD